MHRVVVVAPAPESSIVVARPQSPLAGPSCLGRWNHYCLPTVVIDIGRNVIQVMCRRIHNRVVYMGTAIQQIQASLNRRTSSPTSVKLTALMIIATQARTTLFSSS